MSLFPERRAYKTLPAEWACSPSIELIKPYLLNEAEYRAYNSPTPDQSACSLSI